MYRPRHAARRSRSRLLPLLLIAAMAVLFSPTQAFADTVQADADPATANVQTSLNLGLVDPGATITVPIGFRVTCSTRQHPDEGQTATWTVSSVTIDAAPVTPTASSPGSVGPFPASWPDDATGGGTNCANPTPQTLDSTNAQLASVSVTAPTAPGPHTMIVTFGDDVLSLAGNNDETAITTTSTSVTFTFAVRAQLNVDIAGTGSGTVTDDADGEIDCTDDVGVCSDTYPLNTEVTLTATADSASSTFTGWSGDVPTDCTPAGPDPLTCDVTMDASKNVTATFTLIERTLNVTTAGTGSGTVTDDADGAIDCTDNTGTCTDTYPHGTVVTLTAAPDTATSFFDGWSGDVPTDCTPAGPDPLTCDVTMDASKNVTATFTLIERTLTVTIGGTGSGSVTDDGGQINCPKPPAVGDCTGTYPHGTEVTLTATPTDANSVFLQWNNASPCLSSPICVVDMTADKSVTAIFRPVDRTVTMTIAGTGTGTVNDGDNLFDLDCPPTCTETYPHGTGITFTAVAGPNSVFTGWSGDVPGTCTTGTSCSMQVDSDKDITATFSTIEWDVNVTVLGNGTVTDGPEGDLSCTSAAETSCTETYDQPTEVTLTAAPDANHEFDGWSGDDAVDCVSATPDVCTLTMTEDRDITATFSTIEWDVNVTVLGNGTVTDGPEGDLSCTSAAETSCTETYDQPTVVTLTAVAGSDSTFQGWTGDVPAECAGAPATCQVTMDQARNVTATFTFDDTNLTVVVAGTGTGTVTGTQIDCPGDCTGTYPHGTEVTLTADADPGSDFAGWSGDVPASCTSGTPATCTVDMGIDRTVTATFDPAPAEGADLAISKVDTNDPVILGQNIVYVITITNAGPDTATGVRMLDVLPSGATFVGVKSTQGSCTYRSDRHRVGCFLGTIADSGFARVRIAIRPQSTGTYANYAQVWGSETDPNLANNTDREQTRVRRQAS